VQSSQVSHSSRPGGSGQLAGAWVRGYSQNSMPWHPIFIHFPIALLSAAVVTDAAALLLHRQAWHRIAYALLAAGTAGAAASVVSGNADAAGYRESGVAAAIQEHEDLGTATFLLFLIALLGRLPRLLRPRVATGSMWIWVTVGGVGLVLLALTSFHGGELVYDEAVGVQLAPSEAVP